MRQFLKVHPDFEHWPDAAQLGQLALLSAHLKPVPREGAGDPVGGGGDPVGGDGDGWPVDGDWVVGGAVGGNVEPPQTLQLCSQLVFMASGLDWQCPSFAHIGQLPFLSMQESELHISQVTGHQYNILSACAVHRPFFLYEAHLPDLSVH